MQKTTKDYVKRIGRNIVKGSLDATAWSLSLLFFMGEATMEVFLNPSYYGELPSGNLDFIKIEEVKKKGKKLKNATIRQSIRRLQKQGFISEKNGKFQLTNEGKKVVDYVSRRKRNLNAKWDKKYRVVIFDIPEKNSCDRDWLRGELYLLKYKQLQKSVYASKYPLTIDIVKEIKRRKIGDFVDYLLVDKIYSKF